MMQLLWSEQGILAQTTLSGAIGIDVPQLKLAVDFLHWYGFTGTV